MNSLKAFEAVSRLMSVNAAARELSVSHGAVSQQVRVLESFLGRELFVRTGNALRLSDAGAGYAKVVRKALTLVATDTERLLGAPDAVRLRISVPPTFATRWLIPKLPRFHEAQPGIDISLDVSARLAKLGSVAVDAAIRFGTTRDPSLEYVEIYKSKILIVGSPKYLARRGAVAALEQLSEHKLIGYRPGTRSHTALHVGWEDVAKAPLEFSIDAAEEHQGLTAAIEGRGLVLVEDLYVKDDLEAGRLNLAFERQFPAKASYRLALPIRSPHRKELKLFSSWLRAELRGR